MQPSLGFPHKEKAPDAALKKLIDSLKAHIMNPSEGLPEEVFLFISALTPMVNVDLLITNDQRQTLLTWRDDDFHPPGWHIPGGIIRFSESIADRIAAVAKQELGTSVEFKTEPLMIREIRHPQRNERGHFISLLFDCRLTNPPAENLRFAKGTPKPGEWAWHDKCPDNIIPVHEIYRELLSSIRVVNWP